MNQDFQVLVLYEQLYYIHQLNNLVFYNLKYLLYLQSVGYIGYIRIVTNGTIVPKDNVIKLNDNPRYGKPLSQNKLNYIMSKKVNNYNELINKIRR